MAADALPFFSESSAARARRPVAILFPHAPPEAAPSCVWLEAEAFLPCVFGFCCWLEDWPLMSNVCAQATLNIVRAQKKARTKKFFLTGPPSSQMCSRSLRPAAPTADRDCLETTVAAEWQQLCSHQDGDAILG